MGLLERTIWSQHVLILVRPVSGHVPVTCSEGQRGRRFFFFFSFDKAGQNFLEQTWMFWPEFAVLISNRDWLGVSFTQNTITWVSSTGLSLWMWKHWSLRAFGQKNTRDCVIMCTNSYGCFEHDISQELEKSKQKHHYRALTHSNRFLCKSLRAAALGGGVWGWGLLCVFLYTCPKFWA